MDPLAAPPDTPVFWRPEDDTSVVLLAPPPGPLQLGIADPVVIAMDRTDERGSSVTFDLGGGQTLPLLGVPTDGGAPVLALVPLGLDGFDRVESIVRLLCRIHGRVVPADTRLTRQQRQRQRRMLQAIDGDRAGATQLEIAQVLFRVGRLGREEWQSSSARYSVSSLLRDARTMIGGGYLNLLRHRRLRQEFRDRRKHSDE